MTIHTRRQSTKTLSCTLTFPLQSLHPLHPLVLLSSPPSAPDSTLSLYRTSTSPAQQVWQWSPPTPPLDPAAPTTGPPRKGLAALRAAKAASNKGGHGHVQLVRWSPDGQVLAVVVSPPPSATPATAHSTLHLLSLHTGTPLSPSPISLPSSASGKTNPTHLSWLTLPSPSSSPASTATSSTQSSHARSPKASKIWSLDLISRLPPLPSIPKDSSSSTSSSTPAGANLIGGVGGGGPTPMGGGSSGVMAAKQAMLERERAKEAQRALNVREACKAVGGFPGALERVRVGEIGWEGDERVGQALRGNEEGEGEGRTVLVVGDNQGGLALFLGGSVYLGSISLRSSGTYVAGVRLVPPSAPNTLDFVIHSAAPNSLSLKTLSLPLPPTLVALLSLSTALRAHVSHIFEALQEARNLWDEARRIGKGWLQRITDVARPHGITTPPPTLLLTLLLTGRPSPALADFLSSKMNERGLIKWEQQMTVALERLRGVGWKHVGPGLERVVVLLREGEGWGRWSAFDPHSISRLSLLRALALACEAIRSVTRMQREVEEEERQFVHFGRWLRYEIEKLTHLPDPSSSSTSSDLPRPLALFHPLPVAHYIRWRLSAGSTVPLAPYLSFGLASKSLEECEELKEVERWVGEKVPAVEEEDEKEGDGIRLAEGRRESGRQELEKRVRRMKEEIKGQMDAQEVLRRRRFEGEEREAGLRGPGRGRGGRGLFGDFERDVAQEELESPPPPPPPPAVLGESTFDDDDLRPGSPSSSRLPASSTSTSTSTTPRPKSLPAMLHHLAKLTGEAMDEAVRKATGESREVKVGEEVTKDDDVQGEVRIRTRVVREGLVEGWVAGGVVRFTRPAVSQSSPELPSLPGLRRVEHAAYSLKTSEGAESKVLEFDLLPFSVEAAAVEDGSDGVEALFGVEVAKGEASSSYHLVLLPLSSLTWTASPPSSTSLPPLPLSPPLAQSTQLDAHYPPSSLVFSCSSSSEASGVKGEERKVTVASLAGEGRRVEVLSLSFGGEGQERGENGERKERDVEML
ncbi:hypothetical protein JCM11641_000875 [Rhodosporidiobolus odoratus]